MKCQFCGEGGEVKHAYQGGYTLMAYNCGTEILRHEDGDGIDRSYTCLALELKQVKGELKAFKRSIKCPTR